MVAAGVRPLVLVIDDEAAVRRLLREVLAEQGFDTELAGSGEEGIALYRTRRDGIDLVLLDVQLGKGLDGPHTLAALRGIDPAVRCCFMTGHPGRYTWEDLHLCGGHCVLRKPLDFPTLQDSLRAALKPRASE